MRRRLNKIKNKVKRNVKYNEDESNANEELYIAIVDKLQNHLQQLKTELNTLKEENGELED